MKNNFKNFGKLKKNNDEERLQIACVLWFDLQYTKYRNSLNCNLNNSRNAIDGARNKKLGLRKGRPDMVFYFKSKTYHIEFKTIKGRQSKEQKEWQKYIESQGFTYVIIRDILEFKKYIDCIINE